jgi:hypothetical protein
VLDVLILSLVDGGSCGTRVPVLRCADALRELGAKVETFAAGSDQEIDDVLARISEDVRLIVAVEDDGQLRHIMRRMVRRYAPAPSQRPASLAANRTIPDLPAIGLLPLAPGGLPAQLGLSSSPAEVASAVLGSSVRRLDLLRQDGGAVTLDAALLGAADPNGVPIPWHGQVEVDDAVLSQGSDPILALSISNGSGASTLDGLPLVTSADPSDGLIDVAIAVPVTHKPLLGKARVRFEVRRARGRAVSVTPHEPELPILDDGVAGRITHKRSWWIEPGAWSVYTSPGRDEP